MFSYFDLLYVVVRYGNWGGINEVVFLVECWVRHIPVYNYNDYFVRLGSMI